MIFDTQGQIIQLHHFYIALSLKKALPFGCRSSCSGSKTFPNDSTSRQRARRLESIVSENPMPSLSPSDEMNTRPSARIASTL
mmetsp:Transcript_5699/g.7013  ORF Transcript_5699/g.7013 Transcript_5699/m.7013 type:complete len:83 (-) Transcript_5699:509-757(-)